MNYFLLLFPLLEVTEDLLLEAFSCVLKRKFINSELLRPLIFFSIKAYENNMAIVSTIMMIKFSMSFFMCPPPCLTKFYIMYGDKFIWNFYVKFLWLISEKYYNKIIFKRLVCRFIGFTSNNTEEWFFKHALACLILYIYIYISYVLAGWCMRELYAKLIFF